MSSDKQKTFDGQTAQFLGIVGQNMPRLTSEVMQRWVENPKALQKVLSWGLQSDPKAATSMVQYEIGNCIERSTTKVSDPDGGNVLYDINTESLPLPYKQAIYLGQGVNPFKAMRVEDLDFRLGVEYAPGKVNRARCLALRPYLVIEAMDGVGEGCHIPIRSIDYWADHAKAPIVPKSGGALTILEADKINMSEHLWDLEIGYVNGALEYISDRFTFGLSIEDQQYGWLVHLHWLTDGGAALNTFRFQLRKEFLVNEYREAKLEPPTELLK